MNKKVLKVGNLSTGNSQAGTIYRTWGGISPTLCAGTHGYALGYIVVNKKKVSKKQIKCRRNEL